MTIILNPRGGFGGSGGGSPSGPLTAIRVKRGTTQSIPTAIATTYVYNEEDYDELNEFDTTTGVFTASTDGRYVVSASVSSEESWTVGEKCILELHVDGTLESYLDTVYAQATGALSAHISGTTTVDLLAGQTIDIRIFHDRGIALNTLANGGSMSDGQFNYITIHKIQGVTSTATNLALNVQRITTDYTIQPEDQYVISDGGNNITLPLFANATQPVTIINAGVVNDTILGNGSTVPNSADLTPTQVRGFAPDVTEWVEF